MGIANGSARVSGRLILKHNSAISPIQQSTFPKVSEIQAKPCRFFQEPAVSFDGKASAEMLPEICISETPPKTPAARLSTKWEVNKVDACSVCRRPELRASGPAARQVF